MWNFIVQSFAKVVNSDIWWFCWVFGHNAAGGDQRCYKNCKTGKNKYKNSGVTFNNKLSIKLILNLINAINYATSNSKENNMY